MCIVISLVLLATILQTITFTGFGIGTENNISSGQMLSSGFLVRPDDHFSYASWAEQARKGSYFFSDMFTTDDHDALFFNPYFVLIGVASRALGTAVITTLILGGMIGMAITLFASFYISLSLHFPARAARWGTLFVGFASGFSTFIYVLHYFFQTKLTWGADVAYQDAILFSTFIAFPYQAASVALMVLVIYCIRACEQRKIASNYYTLILLSFLSTVTILTHPYEMVMLLSSYSLFVMIMQIRGDRASTRRWPILLLVTIAIIPAIVYHCWLIQQPVWNSFGLHSLDNARTRLSWLIGYGTMLPLSIVGACYCWYNDTYSDGLWFGAWVCLLVVLLIILAIPQTKVCSGGHFPMCVLAGLGFSKILARAREVSNIYLRTVGLLAAALILLSTFVTSIGLALEVYKPRKYDADVGEVLTAIKERSNLALTTPRVLCNTKLGLLAPTLAGVRVFAGHPTLTPDYNSRRANLVEAGVEFADSHSTSNGYNRHVLYDLVERHRFDYVVLEDKSVAQSFILDSGNITLIGVCGRFSLYKVSQKNKMVGRE